MELIFGEFGTAAVFFLISLASVLVWCPYVLRPLYRRLNEKVGKPFYDNATNPLLDDEFKGKWVFVHYFLEFLPASVIGFIMPELLFPGHYYICGLIFVYGVFYLPICVVYYRDKVFIPVEISQISEDMVCIVHFSSKGYSQRCYWLLAFVIMFICVIYGIINYLRTPSIRFAFLVGVCVLLELMTLYPDYTDRIMPFDMKTKNGFVLWSLITLCLSMGLAFKVY